MDSILSTLGGTGQTDMEIVDNENKKERMQKVDKKEQHFLNVKNRFYEQKI